MAKAVLGWRCWNSINVRSIEIIAQQVLDSLGNMKFYLLILPVSFLVAYSQIIVKWRVNSNLGGNAQINGITEYLLFYLKDPVVISAYGAALLASFAWLFIVTKLPLAIAFPIYIGITFGMVLLGGWFFLSEPMTMAKILAIALIFSGIAIGVRG